ncbi:alpha/beta hydrolase [Sorangium sp. So ce1128]
MRTRSASSASDALPPPSRSASRARTALSTVPERSIIRNYVPICGLPRNEAAVQGAPGSRRGLAGFLVYLCAFMLGPGESLLSAIGGQDPPWWITSADGRTVTPAHPRDIFYNDCIDEVAAAAEAALVPQARASFTRPLTTAAWQELPSTYVICERDNAIPVFAQEAMSQRAREVRRLDAGHSPFLSRPGDVVALVRDVFAKASG